MIGWNLTHLLLEKILISLESDFFDITTNFSWEFVRTKVKKMNKFQLLISTSLLSIVCSKVDTLRMDDPNNLANCWFCHVNGAISPVHGVRLSSGKKHCVFKNEDYEKHEGLNWANLTFKDANTSAKTSSLVRVEK